MEGTFHGRQQSLRQQADPYSWWATVRNVGLPWRKIGKMWLLITVPSAGVAMLRAMLDEEVELPFGLHEYVQVPPAAVSTVGAVSGLLLAFRLAAAVTKWTEARCLWGEVITRSRTLLSELMSSIDDEQSMDLARNAADWCVCVATLLKEHLREPMKQRDQPERERATTQWTESPALLRPDLIKRLINKGIFLSLEGKEVLGKSSHRPLCAVYQLQRTIFEGLHEQSKQRSSACSGGSEIAFMLELCLLKESMGKHTNALIAAITGTERIKNTPIPPGYVGVHRCVLLAWLVLLPFSLEIDKSLANHERLYDLRSQGDLASGDLHSAYTDVNQLAVQRWISAITMLLATAFVSFLTLAVEQIAVEIEHPFSTDLSNGLPLDSYVLTVKQDVKGLLADHERCQRIQAPMFEPACSPFERGSFRTSVRFAFDAPWDLKKPTDEDEVPSDEARASKPMLPLEA